MSQSPSVQKAIPEAASDTFDFYAALRHVVNGKRVTKLEWGEGYWIELRGEYLQIRKPDGEYYNLIVRDADILGQDWRIV